MQQSSTYQACLTIHYHRYDGCYDGWYLWIWLEGRPGALFEFTGQDDYGVFSRLDCQRVGDRARVGLLVKKSRDRWDEGKEEARFIEISRSTLTEIWLLEAETKVYYQAPEIKISAVAAFADDPRFITVNLSSAIASDKEGELKAVPFSLHEKSGAAFPMRAIRNRNLLGKRGAFNPRQDGYEIMENGAVRFVYDPSQGDPSERLDGPRSIFVLGTHNHWQQGEGDPRWKMLWNEREGYYELTVWGLPQDGSIQFKFKEFLDDPGKGWVPEVLDPPLTLLGLQTRKLAIELEKDLDIRQEYYLDGQPPLKVIPRQILTDQRYLYQGNDLGAVYSPEATVFKAFAPAAIGLSVILYPDLWSDQSSREVTMTCGANGVFSATVAGDLKGFYYTFRVFCYGQQSEIMDPYCRCTCSRIRGLLTEPKNRLAQDLGIFYTHEAVNFRFSLPKAQGLQVVLYRAFDDQEGFLVPLIRDEEGVFQGSQSGDWKDSFYMLRYTDQEGQEKELVDPWAETIAIGPSRGKIIDLAAINQQINWQEDHSPPFGQVIQADGLSCLSGSNKPQDNIIYELHLRDFTIAANSGVVHKGLYSGLAETSSHGPNMESGNCGPNEVKTGLDHLLELGITHIQIMPTHNFSSWIGQEKFRIVPHYNWGYMPVLFFSPEVTFATDPTNESSIIEFKLMIKRLHQAGLRVIMDVVYNHYDRQAPFDLLAPYYYFRLDEQGQVSNGSGTGNEFNSASPMARKLILDSLRFWVEEYHLDGFRFDLMGLIDRETMKLAVEELRAIHPTILLYGEPWAAGPSSLGEINAKGKQRGQGYGVFNDHFRDAIKGSPNGQDSAFIQGFSSEDIALRLARGLQGSIEDFAQEPQETINYVSCHDDLVLRDKLEISTTLDENRRQKMVKLAGLMILTAQGIPFIHAGLEIFRTKRHIANSYNQPDSINQIDWQLKVTNANLFRYLQGAIALRKSHPAFRLASAEEIRKRVQITCPLADQIIYSINGASLIGEAWERILVLFNGNANKAATFILPEGAWREVRLDRGAGEGAYDVACDGACKDGESYFNSVTIEPTSAMVLHQIGQ